MITVARERLLVPARFKPPIVTRQENGTKAFHSYDWYFEWMKLYLKNVRKVFLTPCAATKPIHSSPLHRSIYQKLSSAYGKDREVLVVSEPVVLIRYLDLYELEKLFCYDFPPKLLSSESRAFFVERLRLLLTNKDVSGCLPRHHAVLINDAIGSRWKNYWQGDLYSMMKKASLAIKPSP